MMNQLNKFLDNYIHFVQKKYFQFIAIIALIFWLGFLFFLYTNSYSGRTVQPIALVLFLGTCLYFWIRPEFSKKIAKLIFKEEVIEIKLKYLLAGTPVLLILLANYLVLTITGINKYFIQNFIVSELNILYKIFSLYIFYLLFLLLVYLIGKKIIRLTGLNIFSNGSEQFLFAIGIGFFPIIIGTFALLLFGVLYSWFVWTLVIGLAAFCFSELKETVNQINERSFCLSFKEDKSIQKNIIIFTIFILLAFSFVSSIKPLSVTTDDLSVYYNVPKLFSEYHSYRPIMHHPMANMGQNTEMIYTAIITAIGSPYMVHFQLFSFALVLLGFYSLMKRLFNEQYAALVLFVLYFVPWNNYYPLISKVEMFLVFYAMLMIYSFFLWYQDQQNNKALLYLGIFAGIAMGIKYNSLILILILYSYIFIKIIFQKNKIVSVKAYFISIFLALLLFSPWMIKNQIYFQNVLYPTQYLIKNKINKSIFPQSGNYARNRGWEISELRHSIKLEDKFTLKGFFSTIWHQSIADNVDRGHWINFGFVPILIIPFYFLFIRDRKIIPFLIISIAGLLIWYKLDGARPWYMIFIIMIFYAIIPYILTQRRVLTYFYFSITISAALLFTHVYPVNLAYLSGYETEESYKTRTIPYYETAQYINSLNLSTDERIFQIGDFRVFPIERNDELMYVDQYLIDLSYSLNQGNDYFYNVLKDNSFKYIIYSTMLDISSPKWPNINGQTVEEYLIDYDKDTPSIYEDIKTLRAFLENRTTLVFDDGFYYLYKL